MNSCNFIGRVTSAPELKKTQSDISVCSFCLAVKRPRVKDKTDFINCVAFRQSAEYLCTYGKKGSVVEISGALTSRKYEDKNGNNRVAFEVVADNLSLWDHKSDNTEESNLSEGEQEDFEEFQSDDDLPF